MDDRSDDETSTDTGDRTRTDPTDRSLGWAWVASLGIVGFTLALILGAYVLTSGTPDCQLYAVRRWRLCPWYRQYLRNGLLLFGASVLVFVPFALLVGGARAIRRQL